MTSKFDKVASVDDAYMQVMIFLARTFPHLYFLSKYLRVVYDEKADYIASTDGKVIRLSPAWLSLPYHARLAVFMHELYHVFLKHPLRAGFILRSGIDRQTALVACDAKTNYALMLSLESAMSNPALYEDILPTYNVPEEMLEKASVEEIAKWLHEEKPGMAASVQLTAGMDVQPAGQDSSSSDDEESDESSQGSDSGQSNESQESESDTGLDTGTGSDKSEGAGERVLNEGKKELINASQEQFEEELNKVIRDSLISAKTAGATLSAIEERILSYLTKSKVNWRSMLRNWVTSYIKSNIVQSYIRTNRRMRDLPGQLSITKPNAWVFVDVSGSIGDKEFEQFMSEIVRLSSFVSEVKVITWDTRVTGEYTVSSADKQKLLRIKFRGGGGTRFVPVLSEYMDKIKSSDIFICLTDGLWYDFGKAVELLKKVRAFKILVTTHANIPEFNKSVKIEVEA